MHQLNENTKASIRRIVGLDFEQMQKMSAEEIDAFIEKRISKRLKPALSMKGLINRGSVFLYSNRLLSMDAIDKRLEKI
jgi:hypothetical protein